MFGLVGVGRWSFKKTHVGDFVQHDQSEVVHFRLTKVRLGRLDATGQVFGILTGEDATVPGVGLLRNGLDFGQEGPLGTVQFGTVMLLGGLLAEIGEDALDNLDRFVAQ